MADASESGGKTALEVEGLTAGYGDIEIVHGIDLSVSEGSLVSVVGPNGAGKSTLLKAILGLVKVFDGSIRLDGHDVTRFPLEQLVRRGIGYVPQVDDVFETLRVHENLEMGGYLLDKPTRARRIEEVLEFFPVLAEHMRRYVGTMSGGERKMVAVGRALMTSPRVVIFDEPTAGLAPTLVQSVLEDQARALADRGKAVLLVEQRAHAALQLSDWAYVLVQGRVARSARAADVLSDPEMGEVFLGGAVKS
ncbi:MAG: ABC transporter ATP-binding protein [Actinobacteria bacterium]|nr:ABC transporter ATP-binding protein [Actinomycetota bacterium]